MLFGWFRGAGNYDENKIQDLNGKVILITGGNVGLGRETIRVLSKHNPAKIYCAARTEEKALNTIRELKEAQPNAPIEFLKLDLTDLHSVQEAARNFLAKENRLDILFLNAGIMATPAGLTKDGYEIQFGTNHLGHALLTNLLLPILLKTAELPGADVRTIWLSSAGHLMPPTPPLQLNKVKTDMKGYLTWKRYGQSKLCNILYASELAKRYPQILSVALHPGMVDTALYKSFFGSSAIINGVRNLAVRCLRGVYLSVEEGARNQLWAATAPRAEVENGGYYDPVGVKGTRSGDSKDQKLAEELWTWTERELRPWMPDGGQAGNGLPKQG